MAVATDENKHLGYASKANSFEDSPKLSIYFVDGTICYFNMKFIYM